MIRNRNKLENRRGERQHQLKHFGRHLKNPLPCMTAYILQCGCNGSYYHGKSQYYFNNRAVNRVNTKEEAAYNHIKYHLYHIQYVLFGDEVDTDTNQMDDGNNGSQSYISINSTITNLIL